MALTLSARMYAEACARANRNWQPAGYHCAKARSIDRGGTQYPSLFNQSSLFSLSVAAACRIAKQWVGRDKRSAIFLTRPRLYTNGSERLALSVESAESVLEEQARSIPPEQELTFLAVTSPKDEIKTTFTC